jgi:preprotein translocase subunit YajC
MGTTHLMAAVAAAKSSSSATSLIFIVIIFGALMLFMFRSQRRRQQNSQNTQRAVVNGTRVRTVAGIYGTVVDSDDRNVMIEVAPGVTVKMLRQAIAAVVPEGEPDGLLHSMSDAPEPDHADSGFSSGDASTSPDQKSDVSR